MVSGTPQARPAADYPASNIPGDAVDRTSSAGQGPARQDLPFSSHRRRSLLLLLAAGSRAVQRPDSILGRIPVLYTLHMDSTQTLSNPAASQPVRGDGRWPCLADPLSNRIGEPAQVRQWPIAGMSAHDCGFNRSMQHRALFPRMCLPCQEWLQA